MNQVYHSWRIRKGKVQNRAYYLRQLSVRPSTRNNFRTAEVTFTKFYNTEVYKNSLHPDTFRYIRTNVTDTSQEDLLTFLGGPRA